MYLALSNVHPVTLAVGNTMKRVFIMVASVMVFRNQISLQAGIGSDPIVIKVIAHGRVGVKDNIGLIMTVTIIHQQSSLDTVPVEGQNRNGQ